MLQLFHGQVEEDGRVGVFPARIAGREEAADIAGGYGAEQGVGNGVQQHIAVGVAGQALGVVERESADAQRHAWFESVRVIAKSDACFHGYRACSEPIAKWCSLRDMGFIGYCINHALAPSLRDSVTNLWNPFPHAEARG